MRRTEEGRREKEEGKSRITRMCDSGGSERGGRDVNASEIPTPR